jgi:ribonuclease Z
MAVLHLLGTGAALADADRTTTMLALESGESVLVVDCGGDVVQRLLTAGLEPERIEMLFVTHEHPDHVGGFPLFMEKIWLAGRRRPIVVSGPDAALAQARRCWESFSTDSWEGVPQIRWTPVPMEEGATVLTDATWRVTAAPAEHGPPTLGVRVEAVGGGTVAYSADSGPSSAIERLAAGADILVHEAGGDFPGHSTVEEAAGVAAAAAAARLVLVHLPPGPSDRELLAAREIHPRVEYGRDGGRYEF